MLLKKKQLFYIRIVCLDILLILYEYGAILISFKISRNNFVAIPRINIGILVWLINEISAGLKYLNIIC